MRGLNGVVTNASRLYRLKNTTSIFSCRQTTEPDPTFVRRSEMRVIGVVVFALSVGLPDFQHRIVDWRTIGVKHTKSDPCTLSLCIGAGDASYTMLIGGQLDLKKRADRL
jgi:hypothetical protein